MQFANRSWNALIILIVLACLSCGRSPLQQSVLPPPVVITYRGSLLGMGQVVQITNASSHHLYNVTVVGRNIQKASSASVRATEHLVPRGSVEIGWLEFGSWVPMPGETIEVYADDYVVPKVSIVPKN